LNKVTRGGVVAALVVGLALFTLVVAVVGYRSVLAAIERAGLPGFAAYTLYWPLVILVLAAAWFAVAPGLEVRGFGILVWARLLREAGSDILPFAQVSGFLLGARVARAEGIAEDVVAASTIADVTAELAAQVLYTLLGVALLASQLGGGPHAAAFVWPIAGALGFLVFAACAFAVVQGRGVAWLGALAQRWWPDSVSRADAVRASLDAIYRRPLRFLAALALHSLGWVGSGLGSWIALRFMGAHAPLWAVLAVESLMYAARGVAFILPGGLGVQEGAYVLLAPLFGLQPSDLLAVSLLRRARDLVVGVPTLLIWQAREGRRLLGRPGRSAPRA
jgi:putative membrane protein